jgi:hypothetical protein
MRVIRDYVDSIASDAKRCVDQVAELQDDRDRLARRVTELEDRLDEAWDVIDRLRDCILDDGPRAESGFEPAHAAHVELAAQVRALARPTLENLAQLAGKSGSGAGVELARLVRGLMVLCLAGGSVDRDALVRALGKDRPGQIDLKADQAVAFAEQLRASIEATGDTVVFSFDHPPEPPDPAHADLWDDTCSADDPVAFVVVPAYLVDDDEISPPIVYTLTGG